MPLDVDRARARSLVDLKAGTYTGVFAIRRTQKLAEQSGARNANAVKSLWEGRPSEHRMIDIELIKVVAELANKIANVTEKLAQVDGARVAHRHVIRTFLASASDADVSELMEQLHSKADKFEDQFGEERIAGYRAELDILMVQSRELRNGED